MTIMIKDMEMPESCEQCRMAVWVVGIPDATMEVCECAGDAEHRRTYCESERPPAWCPLSEPYKEVSDE